MISAADRTRQAQAVAEVIDFMRKQKLSLDDLINVGDADLKSPDNLAAHPEDHGKVPLVELMTDSYHNNHGKQIFVPIFEIVGWVERPAAVRRILPPPMKMLELTAMQTAMPAPSRITSDMDDEIPY